MFSLVQKIKPLLVLLLWTTTATAQKPLIHSHNDYQQQDPLTFAMGQKAAFIEADVYPVEGVLYVAHDKEEIRKSRTLEALYIQPIVQHFMNKGSQHAQDSVYTFALCIDIKENATESLRILEQLLQPYAAFFDRSRNKAAVQVIISGDRGDQTKWKHLPDYIYFDGRPFETYDAPALARIATISDNFKQYKTEVALTQMIEQAHRLQKPVRLWGAPDNEDGWNNLLGLGVDIINTDYPDRARTFLNQRHKAMLSK